MTHLVAHLAGLYLCIGGVVGGYTLGCIHESEGRVDAVARKLALLAWLLWPLALVWHWLTNEK